MLLKVSPVRSSHRYFRSVSDSVADVPVLAGRPGPEAAVKRSKAAKRRDRFAEPAPGEATRKCPGCEQDRIPMASNKTICWSCDKTRQRALSAQAKQLRRDEERRRRRQEARRKEVRKPLPPDEVEKVRDAWRLLDRAVREAARATTVDPLSDRREVGRDALAEALAAVFAAWDQARSQAEPALWPLPKVYYRDLPAVVARATATPPLPQ